MIENKTCTFCDRSELAWRTIRFGEQVTSFVSRPWFRPGHSLVIPNRHITHLAELSDEESIAITRELGRLSVKLDAGYGTGVMQKFQPTQSENGIKMNHVHFHVFPRTEDEADLFPVPIPNSFEGFTTPSEREIVSVVDDLRL